LLVQRTSWRNVEIALEALRKADLLSAAALSSAEATHIGSLIRSAGFSRTKSVRLQQLARFVLQAGGEPALARLSTSVLRPALLALTGIGPETADSILLYAFDRPVPVIDAYLRRVVMRLNAAGDYGDDDALRGWITRDIDDTSGLNEFHALIVAHGKGHCRARPVCSGCPLAANCMMRVMEKADSDA